MMKKINKKGFTLVELIAVLVILVIIMVIALPNFDSSIDRNLSRQERKIEKALQSSGELYIQENIEDVEVEEISIDNVKKSYCYFSINTLIVNSYVVSDDISDYTGGCVIFNKTDNEYYVSKKFDGNICKKNNVSTSLKCINYLDINDVISSIRLYVEVQNGKTFAKSNEARITLSDKSGHGFKKESIDIYYVWGDVPDSCSDVNDASKITLEPVEEGATEVSGVVTIGDSSTTGKEKVYVCNKNDIVNIDGSSSLKKDTVDSANMYLDNKKPEVTDISSEQKVISAILKDSHSKITYYAVTDSSEEPNESEWNKVDKTTKYELKYPVSEHGVYYIWAKDAVGNVSDPVSWDTINYIDKPTNVLCQSRTYTGASQQLTSLTSGKGYILSDYNGTNAGSYTITATLLEGYKWSDKTVDSVTFQCSINKKNLDVSKFTYSPITKVYDGTTSVPSGFGITANTTSGLVSGDSVTITYTSASYDSADVSTSRKITVSGLSLSGTDKDNYELSDTSYSKTGASITAKTIDDASISPTSYIYDGTAKKPTVGVKAGSKTLTNGTDYTVTITNNINVGTGTVTVKGKGNYTGTINKTFTISKASSSVSLTAKSATYTGSAISANTASVTGTSGSITYTYYTNSSCTATTTTSTGASAAGKAPKDAGTYYVKAVAAADSNWNSAASSCIKHTINTKSITVTWGSTTTFKYTGSAQAPSVTSPVTGVNSEKLTITRTTKTAAGTYTSTASCSSVSGGRAKCANYSLSSNTKSYTISKASSSVSLTAKSTTYTGSAISANTASVTGTSGAITYTYYTNSTCTTTTTTSTGASAAGKAPKDAGTYYVKAVAAADSNWNSATSSCIKHTISKKSIAVTWGSTTTFKYTGSAQAPSVTSPVTGVNSEKLTITRTTKTAVGSYTSTASCSSVSGGRAKCANYSLTNTTKAFTIEKASGNVIIKYSANSSDASISTSTTEGTWYLDSNYIAYVNGSVKTTTIAYGSTIGASGLANYNNSNYMNISITSKSNVSAVSDQEWICLSGGCTVGKTYSQATTTYTSDDFCNASQGDCTVVLGVNWIQGINGDRFVCSVANDNTYRLSVYYITTCGLTNDDYCNYTKKNGLTSGFDFTNDVNGIPTWSVIRRTLDGSPGSSCKSTYYVNANGGFYCRTGADDSLKTTSILYGECNSYTVYKTTMKSDTSGNNWYYEPNNGCYINGKFLQTAACSGGSDSSTNTGTSTSNKGCGETCSSDSQCSGGMVCRNGCANGYCCGYLSGNTFTSCN